jgi:hypothetical protein
LRGLPCGGGGRNHGWQTHFEEGKDRPIVPAATPLGQSDASPPSLCDIQCRERR